MDLNILSQNIRYYRKHMGFTQNKLAERLFVAPQTVSKWESGTIVPDTEKLCQLADIFGVSIDSLIRVTAGRQRDAYIAVDGGGTKTAFVLFYENGEIIDLIYLGGSNPNAYGLSNSKNILNEGIERLMSQGITVKGIFAGISGAAAGKNKQALTEHIRGRYPHIPSVAASDIYNVINSSGRGEKCIAVICGTGSVTYGYDGEMLHRAGGWGYLFDDAGSGFDIGRDAIKHCLEVESGFVDKTELYSSIREAFGGEILAGIDKIYAKGKDYIASFAPIVFECAERDDNTAQGIIARTVDRLAELINFIHKNHDCGNTVVISGGLTSRRDLLEPMIRSKLDNSLEIVFPDLPPIFGAAVKCMKTYNAENYRRDEFYKNFKQSLNDIRKV